jgi:hypothetical protein
LAYPFWLESLLSSEAGMSELSQARLELTRSKWLKALLISRWPQLALRAIALVGFFLAAAAGLAGTPVGSRNFAIIFVWIIWWALLMLAAVPFFGRGWCSICPIPMPGEWLQNGALLGPTGKGLGLGRAWPKKLRSIWLQNLGFVLLALFSAVVLTQPQLTGIILTAFLFTAIGVSLVFERRAFCRYLCPVGGFIGLYSQTSPLQLRVRDTAVCAGHREKTCYTGNSDPLQNDGYTGYGCPWGVFPGGLVKNTNCGLCMECLRTCPHDNLVLQLRPFGADLHEPRGRKLDEAYKAFIMLGAALVYSLVLLGPWGLVKMAAFQVGSLPWLGYAAAFLAFTLALLPGMFYGAVMVGQVWAGSRRAIATASQRRQAFVRFAVALSPLGLAAWIAFSLSFVFANLSYLPPILSDPFGWGWDLFGWANFGWQPYLTTLTPTLQARVLLVGFAWAGRAAYRLAAEDRQPGAPAGKAALPVVLFNFLVTLTLLGLLIG